MARITEQHLNERLRHVLEVHLHAAGGSVYWLQRERDLGFNIRAEVRSMTDLHRLGTMQPAELASRPLWDFVPRSLGSRRSELILGQTGGTLGAAAWTAYTPEEFDAAFVRPFIEAARQAGFPLSGAWLFAGPSGPHIIGRAARGITRALGLVEPFTVDFDPRWAAKLAAGSFAAQRYLEHVVEQARTVLERQEVSVIFSTPSVVAALAQRLPPELCGRIRGVHYGGQPVTRARLQALRRDFFPNALHLAGYGNTLLGCCMELRPDAGDAMVYHPFGARLWFTTLPADTPAADLGSAEADCRGRLMVTRLDESMLLVNLIERDTARLHDVDAGPAANAGFQDRAVIDPEDWRQPEEHPAGLY